LDGSDRHKWKQLWYLVSLIEIMVGMVWMAAVNFVVVSFTSPGQESHFRV